METGVEEIRQEILTKKRAYPSGEKNHRWKGGSQSAECELCGSIFFAPRWELRHRKYCSQFCYWEARINPNKRLIRVHDKIAERVLGKILPPEVVVHHFNGSKNDNNHSNLIICQNQAYHLILHARKRIYNLGGNPNTDKICSRCKAVKPKTEFHLSKRRDGYRCYCKPCQHEIYKEGGRYEWNGGN